MAGAGHSHPISGSISGRIAGPRSGIDPALRSTPHAGVNIPTTPNQLVTPTEQELLEEDDGEQVLEFGDETTEAVNTFLSRYRWPLIGGAIAILVGCIAFVIWLINSMTGEVKYPVRTQSKSNISSQGADDLDKPVVPTKTSAAPTTSGIPKWISVKAMKDAPPAKALQVTSKGGSGTHKTIKSAILAGGSDSHIVIMDEEHQEQFEIEGTQGLRNITIEGWSTTNQPIVLGYSQSSDATKPLITLSNAAGVKLKNVLLRGNATDVEVLKCNGECPGMSITNVGITNYGRQGLVLQHFTGSKEQPARLTQLKSWTDKEKDSAVRVEGNCRDIVIEQGRFDGPFRAAITLAGPLQNMLIMQCRFSKNATGISYQPASETNTSQVRINNCVFSEENIAALQFMQPVANDDSLWDISDNLFLNTKRMATVRNVRFDAPSGINPQWVWADDGQSADNFNVKPGTRYFRKKITLEQVPSLVAVHISCKDHFVLWINGKRVTESVNKFYDQRVVRMDVTRFLVPGANVIAVEATQQSSEPGSTSGMGAAALMVCLYDTVNHKPLTMTDNTWKVTREPVANWNQGEIDTGEKPWETAKPWSVAGQLHWKNAVWDESITVSLGSNDMSRVKGAGNVRDYETSEGFPNLNSIRGNIDPEKTKIYGTNPDDDATFLRYPRNSFLMKSGVKDKPVGYAQDK